MLRSAFNVRRASAVPSACLGIASIALMLAGVARPAVAQDGKTILQNVMQKYRGLTSYQGQSNATMRGILPNGVTLAEEALATTLLYEKSNKLKIDFTMPIGGRTVYYDGTLLAYYMNRTQSYCTLPLTAANLKELAPTLQQLQIASQYDTLYFLAGNDLPPRLVDFKRTADDVRDGRPAYVVTAHEKTRAGAVTWTWTVDKQTWLLDKVEGRSTPGPVTFKRKQNGKIVRQTLQVATVLGQIIVDPKVNAKIGPNAFIFRARPAARRMSFSSAVEQQKRFTRSPLQP